MGKADKVKEKLLELLGAGQDVEVEYLATELGLKKRRLQQIKAELFVEGYVIESGTRKGTWRRGTDRLRVAEGDKDIANASESSTIEDAILATYLFMLQIHDGKLNIDDMYRKLRTPRKGDGDAPFEIRDSEDEKDCESSVRAVTSKAFMGRIRTLEEEGYIELDSRKNVLLKNDYISFLPVMSILDDDYGDEAYHIQNKLELYETSDNQLQEIVRSISRINSGEIEDREIVYMRKRRYADKSKAMKLIRDKMRAVDYVNKACSINFIGRTGKESTVDMKIGLLLYSENQDELYLIGEDLSSGNNRSIREIVVSNVTGIRELDEPNDLYTDNKNREIYDDIYDKMFAVEYMKPVNVEVMFDDFGNVSEKIYQLAASRKTAEIRRETCEDGRKVLIYTDIVIGLHDFAAYIRQYGSACKVLQPKSLQDMHKKSSENIIKRYSLEQERQTRLPDDSRMISEASEGAENPDEPPVPRKWEKSKKGFNREAVERILSIYSGLYPTAILEEDMDGITIDYIEKMNNQPLSVVKRDIYNMLKARNRTNCACDIVVAVDGEEIEIERDREWDTVKLLNEDAALSLVVSEPDMSMKVFVALDSTKKDFLGRFLDRYDHKDDTSVKYSGKLDYRLSHEYNDYIRITQKVHAVIKMAIDEGNDVCFDYKSRLNSPATAISITPMKIVEYGSFGTIYVVTVENDDIRAFRMDRIVPESIKQIKVAGRQKNIDDSSRQLLEKLNYVWDMDLRSGEFDVEFKVYNDLGGRVVDKIRRDLAQYVNEGQYDITANADGSLMVRGHVIGKNAFKRFLRGYGASVVVTAPLSLAKEMLESAEKRLALYN